MQTQTFLPTPQAKDPIARGRGIAALWRAIWSAPQPQPKPARKVAICDLADDLSTVVLLGDASADLRGGLQALGFDVLRGPNATGEPPCLILLAGDARAETVEACRSRWPDAAVYRIAPADRLVTDPSHEFLPPAERLSAAGFAIHPAAGVRHAC